MLYTALSLLAVVFGVTLAVQNGSQVITFHLGQSTLTQVSLGSLFGVMFVAGFLAALFQSLRWLDVLQSRLKRYELKREKAEVTAETNADQVKVLESKIKTLEKALEQALSPSSKK